MLSRRSQDVSEVVSELIAIAGQGVANPTALLVAASQMLTYVGQDAVARRVHAAVLAALHNKRTRTRDLGGKLNTAEFTGAVIAHMGE